MPGYLIHFAACGNNSLKNRSFALGVEAPDILKKHVKIFGDVEKAKVKYDSIRTNEMPDYAELLPRIQQQESVNGNDGLHYGLSSNPNVRLCWNSLSEEQKANPFFRGYVWHLITDLYVYSKLDMSSKLNKCIEEKKSTLKVEKQKLHDDWDKTNTRVHNTYPEIVLPDEVKELNVVQFAEGDLVYVDWSVLKNAIEYLRTFDPLNGDMGGIIETIMNNI